MKSSLPHPHQLKKSFMLHSSLCNLISNLFSLSFLMFFARTSALQSLNIRLSTILLLKDHQFLPNLPALTNNAWKWPGESSKLWKKQV